jgi:Ca2+/Na+ antiporter
MKFKDREAEHLELKETLGLILSLGAIFIQIWVLTSATHSLLSGQARHLAAALVLSAAALGCCALTALTTMPDFLNYLTRGKASRFSKP